MFERLPLTSLKAFEAVARRGSPVLAAAELFVTPGAVTRQIRELEELTGIRLFERGGGEWTVAEGGKALAEAVHGSLASIKGALEQLPGGAVPQLRIGCPRAFATHIVAPRLGAFLRRHAGFRLVLDGDRQDEAPMGGGLDMVVRYGVPEAAPRMRMLVLPQAELFPVCAPAMAKAFAGRTPEQWPAVPLLSFLSVDYWSYWCSALDVPFPNNCARIEFSETGMVIEAAVAAVGIAIGHSQLFADALERGRLARVGPAVLDDRRYYVLLSERADPIAAEFGAWLSEICG